MPFTPFHLGPGITAKALAGERISLAMFAGAQVAMDLEPGIGILTGAATLHGPSHTVAGALIIAFACLPFRPLAERIFGIVIPWRAALAGTLFGTYSHILLDAFVHADIRPLWPFSDANPASGWLGWHETELLCAVLALPALRWLPDGWRWLRGLPWR